MFAIINAASNTIPIAYDGTAGSLLVDGAPSTGQISLYNSTSDFIAFTIISTNAGTALPVSSISTNTKQYLLWPAPSGGASTLTADKFPITQGDKVYIRAVSGVALTTGKVAATMW